MEDSQSPDSILRPTRALADDAHRPASVISRLLSSLLGVLPPIAAILVALAVGGLILFAAGYNPVLAYQVMWEGAFSDLRTFTEVLLNATPLILIGTGLAVAFRCSIWNIGAEGQFYAGAVLSVTGALLLSGLPSLLLVPIVLILGVIGGALWGMLAGYLKVRFEASEIVTTIMLNFVATIGTSYLVTGPLIEEAGKFPQTAQIAEAGRLLRFLPPTRLHIGFLLALALAFVFYVVIFKTSIGYAIRAVGINAEAARYAGIDVKKNILLAMAISGGLAGLAGAVTVAGLTYRLFQTISPGYGFEGIAVALLANNHPIGVIFTGILFGALRSGSEVMQMNAKIPSVMVFAIQGLVILSVVAFGVYQLHFKRRRV